MITEVLLVGAGNMGFAMLSGWIGSGRLDPADAAVVEPDPALRRRATELGVPAFAAAEDLPGKSKARLVVLAVKPQIMAGVVPLYRRFAETGSAFLSIAAGTRMALIEELLGDKVPVVRCMPNTPAAIGQGMMVTVANARVGPELAAFVDDLLAASGAVARIDDERLMDAVTAVSGSGPAYVFHFIECLTDAGIAAGLAPGTAGLLAMQTVYGAAMLAKESGEAPGALRRQVTSPNGTTAAALSVLMGEERLKRLVAEAVEAARRRAAELG
jgi:pyrroline-5-carboxylate reductase